MAQKQLTELTNEELLKEAKKVKQAAIVNAFLIGFLGGVVFYSIVKNTWGFFTLIPLFFIYKLINKRKYDDKALKNILKERGLH